jgi:hypothetical protein
VTTSVVTLPALSYKTARILGDLRFETHSRRHRNTGSAGVGQGMLESVGSRSLHTGDRRWRAGREQRVSTVWDPPRTYPAHATAQSFSPFRGDYLRSNEIAPK